MKFSPKFLIFSRRRILISLILLGCIPLWICGVVPFIKSYSTGVEFSYDLFSLDNFYDENSQQYTGEERSVAKLQYSFNRNEEGDFIATNVFDVRTVNGEQIVQITRKYGIDPYTGMHVIDAGDKDRSGYLFSPRQLEKGESFTYWHVNYDAPADMHFVSEEKIHGLTVYKYETRYEGIEVDQTDNLHHLEGVPEKRGVVLEPYLQLWIEPVTGTLVQYKDETVAYYYDQLTGEKLFPWNKFSNTVKKESVLQHVGRAKFYKAVFYCIDYVVVAVLIAMAVLVFFVTAKTHYSIVILSLFIIGGLLSFEDYMFRADHEYVTVGILRWGQNQAYEENIGSFKLALEQSLPTRKMRIEYVEPEHSDTNPQRHAAAVDSLIAQDVDLIYSITTPGTLIAQEKTADIPIIFSIVTYPVESGIIHSLNYSQNNLVGTRNWVHVEDQFKVFLDIVPNMQRVGFVRRDSEPNSTFQLNEMVSYAQGIGIEVVDITASDYEGLQSSLEAVQDLDALYLACDTLVQQIESEKRILEFAKENNIPDFSCLETSVRQGALAGVIADFEQIGRLAGEKAALVILGATPSSLETSTVARPHIHINLERAKELGVSVPQDILTKAQAIIQ